MRKLTRNPTFRRIGIPIYRLYASQLRFLPPPRVLAISMPKAGTHLLSRLLSLLPKMVFSGLHLSEEEIFSGDVGTASDDTLDAERLDTTLAKVRNGQYMTGHFPAVTALRELIARRGLRTLLILRDPRDVVVSHTFYVTGLRRHFHWDYYANHLPDFSARLMATIRGFSGADVPGGRGQASIGCVIRSYLPWLDEPGLVTCRFEKLIGPTGGGDDETQRQEVARIARAVDRPLADEQIETLRSRVFSTRSRTFRKGMIGDWKNHFTQAHKDAFKEVAGQALVDLGYEDGLDW